MMYGDLMLRINKMQEVGKEVFENTLNGLVKELRTLSENAPTEENVELMMVLVEEGIIPFFTDRISRLEMSCKWLEDCVEAVSKEVCEGE